MDETPQMTCALKAVIRKAPYQDGARVEMPFNIETAFGRRMGPSDLRSELHYGRMVMMRLPCRIFGIREDVRAKIGKRPRDAVRATVEEEGSSARGQIENLTVLPSLISGAGLLPAAVKWAIWISAWRSAKRFYD